MSTEELIAEIETLPEECIAQIHDFIVFLRVKTEQKEPVNEAFPSMNKPIHLGFDLKKISLESNCSTLYSEDMQHGQVIENSLKIINPFVA